MYLASSLLLACGLAADRPFTPLVPLQGKDTCSRCAGWLLPGTIIERSDVPLRIDSFAAKACCTPRPHTCPRLR